jgi:hypothetical protein
VDIELSFRGKARAQVALASITSTEETLHHNVLILKLKGNPVVSVFIPDAAFSIRSGADPATHECGEDRRDRLRFTVALTSAALPRVRWRHQGIFSAVPRKKGQSARPIAAARLLPGRSRDVRDRIPMRSHHVQRVLPARPHRYNCLLPVACVLLRLIRNRLLHRNFHRDESAFSTA